MLWGAWVMVVRNLGELAGVYAKIERAGEHVDNLRNALKSFGDENPQKIRPEYNVDSRKLSLVIADAKRLPPNIGILIGECLYQQRSALDHLIWKLIEWAGNKPPAKSGFPIFTTPEGYKTRSGAMIKGLSASAEKRIRSLQPFNRGAAAQNDSLWKLQELNNTDKHRLLIVTRTFLSGGISDLGLYPPIHLRAGAFVYLSTRMPIENGNVLASFETAQRIVQVRAKLPIEIVFKEIGSTKNEPVIPLLTQLTGQVRDIVSSFLPEFV